MSNCPHFEHFCMHYSMVCRVTSQVKIASSVHYTPLSSIDLSGFVSKECFLVPKIVIKRFTFSAKFDRQKNKLGVLQLVKMVASFTVESIAENLTCSTTVRSY